MKGLIAALCLACAVAGAEVINIHTREVSDALPSYILRDGVATFRPSWDEANAAGWHRLIRGRIPFGCLAVATNYVLTYPYSVSSSNGVIVTNYYTSSRQVVEQRFVIAPAIIDKPAFVLAAEMQYVSIWQYVFGAGDSGYTNASYDDVVLAIAQIGQTNAGVFATTHAMERSFLFIRDWWTGATARAEFHPYPWGLSTNIVIKDVVGGAP